MVRGLVKRSGRTRVYGGNVEGEGHDEGDATSRQGRSRCVAKPHTMSPIVLRNQKQDNTRAICTYVKEDNSNITLNQHKENTPCNTTGHETRTREPTSCCENTMPQGRSS